MILGGVSVFAGRRVLLLQGPLGPFFRRLATELRQVGAFVLKVDFNGGDSLYSPAGSVSYRGPAHEWPAFFENLVVAQGIDTVILFGDCRPMHRQALEVARRLQLEVGVFEEGYVRPNYVTFERHGVNAHSTIPRDPAYYLQHEMAEVPPEKEVGNTFWAAALWAISYYVAALLLRPFYSEYRHHRPLALSEGLVWVRGAVRKQWYKLREAGIQERLTGDYSGRFFLVPLQVHNDAQIHVHSGFDTVEHFIGHVVASFAAHAPKDTVLAIKHHPMDRGYHDYAQLIEDLQRDYDVGGRLFYIHDQHLPTLLTHARGVVLVNSTVGLSALHHFTPLKVCGDALYDMPGLTCQDGLDLFWERTADYAVNRNLYHRFRNYLIKYTQINGSFYQKIAGEAGVAGLAWDLEPRTAQDRTVDGEVLLLRREAAGQP